jgi:hypothetical protein
MASTRKSNGMLTKRQIREAARLESQVGEPRPGFVRDTACALEGPAGVHHSFASSRLLGARAGKRIKAGGKKVRVALAFGEDPDTGQRRTVRK